MNKNNNRKNIQIDMKKTQNSKKNLDNIDSLYLNIFALQNIGDLPYLEIPEKTEYGVCYSLDKSLGVILVHIG